MKTLIAGLIALTIPALTEAAEGPEAPPLSAVLRKPNPQVMIFTPASLAGGQSLKVTHMHLGDGSVRPNSAVQLIVYSSEPDEQGNHAVLFRDFHVLGKDASPVLNFQPYTAPVNPLNPGERTGTVAVLIALLLPAVGPAQPAALPPQDIVSAEITDGTSIGLLVPAVQKVRSAAAR